MAEALSEGKGQFFEGSAKTTFGRVPAGDLVVTAPEVLDEGMTSAMDAG